jgi:hypothetical protein
VFPVFIEPYFKLSYILCINYWLWQTKSQDKKSGQKVTGKKSRQKNHKWHFSTNGTKCHNL